MVFACPELNGSKISNRPHYGISCLRAYLLSRGLSTEYARHTDLKELDEYVDFVRSFKSRIYGLSATDDTLEITLNIAKKLKAKDPFCIIVIGGAISKIETAQYVLPMGFVDAFSIGEGEYTLEQFIYYIKEHNQIENDCKIPGLATWDFQHGKIIFFPQVKKVDINSYPSPILSGLVPIEDLAELGLFSSRGCIHKCLYCSFSLASEWKIRFYDEQRFLDEIQYILNHIPESLRDLEIPIWDDTFSLNLPRAKKLLKKICEFNVYKQPFWLQTRVDCIDEEFIQLAKKAGVDHIGLGLESASKRVLKAIHKVRLKDFDAPGFEPENRFLEQFRKVVSWCKKHNIYYTINIIVGLPEETMEDALETIKFVYDTRPKFYFHSYLRFYTGVPLARNFRHYPYKITAPNLTANGNENPINAKIVEYPYNVFEVPKLPYRQKAKDLAYIERFIPFHEKSLRSVIVGEKEPIDIKSSVYDKRLVYRKKSINFMTKFLKSQYYTVSDFTNTSDDVVITTITIGLENICEFYDLLLNSSKQEDYSRYSKHDETYLEIAVTSDKDFFLLRKLSAILERGGTIKLPNNLTSFQFNGIFFKSSCCWDKRCTAENSDHIYLNNNSVYTCEGGKRLVSFSRISRGQNDITDAFNEAVVAVKEERKCLSCTAYGECSMCMAISPEHVKDYCALQRAKVNINSFLQSMDYIVKQIINPLDLTVFSTSNNTLIVAPPKEMYIPAWAINIGNFYYYILPQKNEIKIMKIGETLWKGIVSLWRTGGLQPFISDLIAEGYSPENIETATSLVFQIEKNRKIDIKKVIQ